MKAYFTASVVGKKYHLADYERIVSMLTSNGIEVTADHILKASEEKIRIESKSERIKFQQKLEGWIVSSDFMIVEASFPSISVGYEIALALHRAKPVLVLYKEEAPSLITDNEENRLVVQKYTSTNLSGIIDDFINYVRGGSDTRFTFFITSEIGAYLDKVSKKTKVPKSVYLRTLITKDMKTGTA